MALSDFPKKPLASAPQGAEAAQAFLASGAEEAEALARSLKAKEAEEDEGPEISLVNPGHGRFAFKLSQRPKMQGAGERPATSVRPSPKPFLRGEMDQKGLEALRLQLAEAETRLTWIHGPERLAALGTAGNARRMMGDLAVAERWLEEAVGLAQVATNGLAWALNSVRLATAIQHQGRHGEALGIFDQVVYLTESPDAPPNVASVAHYARQHRGKCFAELGDMPAARADFEEALAQRQAKGDPELIQSTEAALRALDNWVPW